MSDIDTLHPLDLDSPRLSVENPQARYDKQGERPDAERVAAAMQRFSKDFGRTAATYMESCIHCGQCAKACHFYTATENPKYTPIWKLEPFKQAYKRESGAFSFIYKALNLKHKVTIEELEDWQTLLYDSCTMCGRCSLICPMGIDIATLVGQARHGMFEAGLVPHELWAVAERAEREGSPLGATPKVLKERIDWLADEHDIAIPMDKERADVLIALSSIEIMKYPQSIVSTAKVLNHLGLSWTLRSDGYEATNFGLLSGNSEWQKDMSMKLIQAAIDCGARLVIMPECGHAYGALRWQGANMYGKPLPFQVLHISEFLAEKVRSGQIKLKPLAKSITFHDPCQISRRGGATQAPREVIQALGADLKETEDTGDLNWCCGGGGGVVTIHRADSLRYKAFEIKMQQIDAAGADLAVTSCSNCRQTFDDGQAHFQWDKTMHSLLELVADNLAE
ncbi:(Fe-S)-binding protein [Sulfuriferula sp. AH1]|uniref:(Fe-S)-binding protein n=1 Tax=Sulfuriferula sp. AH1 TaxID=1985873 RepID=UPI000B3B1DE2|nr:(Fe-S)-binding protein [Sulfuriferula sp. AH1]ARU31472.1 (Fe-S)-binding protein [Sulfuriferula sp. AH1]